jgi:2-succinyl-6-hydroxy-2,4-cyclohexadiene-1-carboxylate synthase
MLTALHGFTENDESWRPLQEQMGIAMRCTLLPGHGWKPCPAHETSGGYVAELARVLPDSGDLLGYSMGGRLALQLAIHHPNRVRRLVLISCHAGIRSQQERTARRNRDECLAQILEEDGIGSFVAWWQANPALRTAVPLPRSEDECLRSVRLNQDPLGLAAALRTFGSGSMDDLWPLLPKVTVPVLLVAGGEDPVYCVHHQHMAKVLPNAQAVAIPASGHAVHREQGHTLARTVREFLAAAKR